MPSVKELRKIVTSMDAAKLEARLGPFALIPRPPDCELVVDDPSVSKRQDQWKASFADARFIFMLTPTLHGRLAASR